MTAAQLVGKKLSLMVGDPWSFGTEHGSGPFEVLVKKESNSVLLLRLTSPLCFEDGIWEFLAAIPRHKGEDVKALLHGKKLHVNVISTEEKDAEADPESFGWNGYRGRRSMLMGSLELTTPAP